MLKTLAMKEARIPSSPAARGAAALALALLALAAAYAANPVTKTRQSTYLYTESDPNAKGGVCGSVKYAHHALRGAFAMTPDNPKQVYRGSVAPDGKSFSITGLPVAKYDLLLVGQKSFYEGFRLKLDEDSLTDADRKAIEKAIMKSVPFFNLKKIHRLAGTTGQGGTARCVLQEMRTKPVTLQSGATLTNIQVRSIKVACLEDVGSAGWQLVFTREIIRMEVGPNEAQGLLRHNYLPMLGQIRVMDEIKDLGEIDFTSEKSESE